MAEDTGTGLFGYLVLLGAVLISTGRVALRSPVGERSSPNTELRHTRIDVGATQALPAEPAEEPVARGRLRRRHSERMWGTEVAMLGPAEVAVNMMTGGIWEVDALESLLGHAGLDNVNDFPARDKALTPHDAVRLMGVLLSKPLTLGRYPPRQAANHLLLEVVAAGGEVGREELLRRVERYRQIVVLRPDGYLAWALGGETQQKVGEVEWREGAFHAGNFELGHFYQARGGVFRHADERLEPVQDPVLGGGTTTGTW